MDIEIILAQLSEREVAVVQMVADGFTRREIAERYHTTVGMIDGLRRKAARKVRWFFRREDRRVEGL